MTIYLKFPGQYFNFSLSEYVQKDLTLQIIHKLEWINMQKCLNGSGYNPRDNSVTYKNVQTRKQLNKHLQVFLKITKRTEIEFLNHLQKVLENDSEILFPRAKYTTEDWIATHIILLENSKKLESITKIEPSTIQECDNQTRAYITHFRIQMGDIPAEYDKNTFKVIKQQKYIEECDNNSYQEYRKIINNQVRPDRVIECCRTIINLEDINPAIKNQAKSFLPR